MAFEVTTAFEVFEHFVNPLEEIEKLFEYSPNVIFSTELIPQNENDLENWWYIAPETGQHVAFYTSNSLEFVAKKNGKHYYCKNGNVHVFSSKKFTKDQIDYAFLDIRSRPYLFGLRKKALDFYIERGSLLTKDFDYIRNIINS